MKTQRLSLSSNGNIYSQNLDLTSVVYMYVCQTITKLYNKLQCKEKQIRLGTDEAQTGL